MDHRDDVPRQVLPIPDRKPVGLSTYDAKDPDTRNRTLDRRGFLLSCATFAASAGVGTVAPVNAAQAQQLSTAQSRPNILFMLGDNVGYGVLSSYNAGGYDGPSLEGKTFFLDMTARRRLLARGMSFRPNLVTANGDHIYWDMKTSQNKPTAAFAREQLWTKVGGPLDLSVPMPPDTYGTLGAERTAWD